MSGDASWCLSSALGIDLSGQFVLRVSKTLMRSSTVKFLSLNLARKRFCLTIREKDGDHLCLTSASIYELGVIHLCWSTVNTCLDSPF